MKADSTMFDHNVSVVVTFMKKSDTDNVTHAEVMFSIFIAEHNLPLTVAHQISGDFCITL